MPWHRVSGHHQQRRGISHLHRHHLGAHEGSAAALCVQSVPRARLGHRHGVQHPTQPSCCPGAFPPESAVADKFILSLAAQMSRWV